MYRGIGGVKDISSYIKGNIVSFRRLTATSKSQSRALGFAMKKPLHVLFEIFSIDGRDISPLSQFGTEQEVLFLPHSHFRIVDIKIIREDSNKKHSKENVKKEIEIKGNDDEMY